MAAHVIEEEDDDDGDEEEEQEEEEEVVVWYIYSIYSSSVGSLPMYVAYRA